MTKIAVLADSHYDETSRFAECIRLHDWIAEDLAQRRPDVILHSGDVFEGKSTPEERAAVAKLFQKLAWIAPLVVVRGNHDTEGDLPLFAKLNTKHGIVVEERAAVHVVSGVAVGCLAWPQKSALLSAFGRVSPEQSSQMASESLRNVLRGMGEEMARHQGPRVVLAHAMVTGAKTSTERVLVGMDMEIGLQDLALAGADLYALGHIHAFQHWTTLGSTCCDAPVIYPGTPRRHDFGELEEKGYVFAEIDGMHRCTWEHVVTPATRMVLLQAEWKDGELCGLESAGVLNSEVRVRYQVSSEDREAAKLAEERLKKKLLDRLAVSVKVEAEVVATTRARAPEIATAETTWDKVEILCKTRGIDISERRPSLQQKLAELEMEVQ